jgi:cellulose synthase/poly-beta-1,6-N-acetylglucosamine synthase-like glycosyltransferase
MQTAMVMLAGLLLAYDFQNVLSWSRVRVVAPVDEPTDDFTIVVPVYGHPRYFAGRDALAVHKANVLVALETTPPVMAAFADELEAEGWRVGRYRLDDPDPATLLTHALAEVTTTIALRLDADTRLGDGLPLAVAAVLVSGADLCSVKCEVENTTNLVTRLQHVEYRMAMLGRHIRPWLTSGACFIGRTSALRALYGQHSLWTPGEDIETGIVAKAMRMKVRHCDFVVTTDAPDTWRGLYRQRRLWWAGNFRHWSINADKNLVHRPVMMLYAFAGIWSSVYWKWWGMVDLRTLPFTLFALWVFYVFWTVIVNFQVRSRYMALIPFYSLVQGMVMPPLGALTYVRIARRRGSLGRYRFGYRRRAPGDLVV